MSEDILINVTPQETRVAVVLQGAVQELHIERTATRGIVGNIYLGRMVRVLPGMQSAFIDIGLERAAFLHVADIWRVDHHSKDSRNGDTAVAILDEAEDLFSKHGFHGVTIREVAREAGVDTALLHYYFGTKRGLFDAVFLRRAELINRYRLDAMDLAVADDAESGAVGSAADAVGHLLAAAGDLAAGIGVDAEMALRRQADALTAQIIDHELT